MALVCAIVTLFLIGALSMTLVRATLNARTQAQLVTRRVQTEWLAESGLNRAAAKLRRRADYQGEVWQIPATELSGVAGRVEIKIANDPASPGNARRRQATITADYPIELPHRNRVVKTVILQLPAASAEAAKKQ